jgi:hypothetical protein
VTTIGHVGTFSGTIGGSGGLAKTSDREVVFAALSYIRKITAFSSLRWYNGVQSAFQQFLARKTIYEYRL